MPDDAHVVEGTVDDAAIATIHQSLFERARDPILLDSTLRGLGLHILDPLRDMLAGRNVIHHEAYHHTVDFVNLGRR